MAPAGSKTVATLEAHYESPKSTTTFAHPLDAPSVTCSTEEKTAYLSALRKSVSKLQEEVNAFLTQEMERDKALPTKGGVKVNDKKEEDNYGEEVLDDEDT